MPKSAEPPLPTDGAALLAFKHQTEAPPELKFGRAGGALDDPQTRLAELQGFDELDQLPEDEDEREAALVATAASAALAAATVPTAALCTASAPPAASPTEPKAMTESGRGPKGPTPV